VFVGCKRTFQHCHERLAGLVVEVLVFTLDMSKFRERGLLVHPDKLSSTLAGEAFILLKQAVHQLDNELPQLRALLPF
jgi:hypothetical protein